MSKDTQIQKQIEEAVERFEKEFLHGMQIHVSIPYSQMALERQFFNEQVKFLREELLTIATKSAEYERKQIMRETGAVFVNWDKSKEEQQ